MAHPCFLAYKVLLNPYPMKYGLVLIFACCALCAQDKPASPSGFQTITNPNDERLKIFEELNIKAKAGDTNALASLGDYYFYGQFPVVLNTEIAKEIWTKAASLGSAEAAARMQNRFHQNSTDSEEVIEKTKWSIITYVLGRIRVYGETKYPAQYSGVSDSSFGEAKARAAAFIAEVKISKPPLSSSGTAMSATAASATAASGKAARVPALSFESLSLFDRHRKNVCSAYLKAASPIYNKGEAASSVEKEAFTAAAKELVRLQSYIGKRRRLSLDATRTSATQGVDYETINDCYAKMSAAKIATSLPATRAELNEASIYINALGKIMQLPVSFY